MKKLLRMPVKAAFVTAWFAILTSNNSKKLKIRKVKKMLEKIK